MPSPSNTSWEFVYPSGADIETSKVLLAPKSYFENPFADGQRGLMQP